MATTVDCDPNALLAASKCFKCIPVGEQGAVMLYLLAIIAGETTDPDLLLAKAKCFKCIPPGMQGPVMNYLLCQIATIEGA